MATSSWVSRRRKRGIHLCPVRKVSGALVSSLPLLELAPCPCFPKLLNPRPAEASGGAGSQEMWGQAQLCYYLPNLPGLSLVK